LSASESQDTENILLRLRRIEGQVRGLQHMIEERRNCEEIITQLMAVRAALDQVGLAAMQKYMAECVPDASEEARANLRRAMVLLLKLSR
jgi:DNA-binding FrmR family transcriptional regulator